MKTLVNLVFWVFLSFCSIGQSTVTLKYFGMTIHPFGDRTAHLQPYRLDDKARFVLNYGGFAGYEKFVYKDLISVKLIQGIFTDCSGGWESVTHLGVRALMFENDKNRAYLGFGPTFMLRESWTRFGEDYQSSGFFHEKHSKRLGDIQYKFILYGFEMEYDRILNDNNSLSVGFTPGIPMAMIISVGWKHWFNRREFDYLRPVHF